MLVLKRVLVCFRHAQVGQPLRVEPRCKRTPLLRHFVWEVLRSYDFPGNFMFQLVQLVGKLACWLGVKLSHGPSASRSDSVVAGFRARNIHQTPPSLTRVSLPRPIYPRATTSVASGLTQATSSQTR